MTIVAPNEPSALVLPTPAVVTRHWGIVQAVASNGTITAKVDGVTVSNIGVMSGYVPTVGDIVLLDMLGSGNVNGGGLIIAIGSLSVSPDSPATAVTGPDLPGAAAVIGTLLKYARQDHDHGMFPIKGAFVAANQGTASGAYTDLATVGPAVTVTTGVNALVMMSCIFEQSNGGDIGSMGVAVTGASTIAAASSFAIYATMPNTGAVIQNGQCFVGVLTGLTAGSNTFTAKYSTGGAGTASFQDRYITVIPMS